ncbi:uncharacterized protein At4g08330, chloroplastic-like [Lolium rigidum]|uniref:uncharacterized protein At4g08330, chloroplastic-like n=1 Tax=Lolium rigidum TaxID=89674 RepID=UPI001F5D6F69|nr:uncharacterized protein At4g08330, chloroplastic-like [Lolium rigidum]
MVRSQSLDSYSSVQDVTYSCGYCGYALNLSSSARDTATIGYSKYGKQIRKGVVAFHAVDESRFTLADEVTCAPYLRPGRSWSWSWGLFRRRARLLCRKCGGRIGAAYQQDDDGSTPSACGGGSDDDLRTSSGDSGGGASRRRSYVIRISALQPSSDDFTAVPFSL